MGLIGLVVFPVLALLGNPIFADFGLYLKNVFIVGLGGFITGTAFGVVLTALEHRKTLQDLSFLRIAMWGGIGGLVLAAISGPAASGSFVAPIIVFTILGIGSATGSVALAKKAHQKELGKGEDEPPPALEG
jgi:hypothetical protein